MVVTVPNENVSARGGRMACQRTGWFQAGIRGCPMEWRSVYLGRMIEAINVSYLSSGEASIEKIALLAV
jgi:hypothetical protein